MTDRISMLTKAHQAAVLAEDSGNTLWVVVLILAAIALVIFIIKQFR